MDLSKLWLIISILITQACDNLGVGGLSDGSIVFDGVSKINYSQDGSYIFGWTPANYNDPLQYLIYVQEVSNEEDMGTATGISLMMPTSSRAAIRSKVAAKINPEKMGVLLATLEGTQNSYALKFNLKPESAYAFLVRARDKNGNIDSNTQTIVISAITSDDSYQGCALVEAISASQIKIEVDFPQSAKSVTIFRDNAVVKIIEESVSRTFIDENLQLNTDYSYRCEAEMGSETLVGANQPTLQTINPFNQFVGCTSGEIVGNRNVKINFEFPVQADEVAIFRDGISIYTSTSAAGTNFIDSDLLPGKTYNYICEARKGNVASSGSRNLEVRIPDTLGSFNGCLDAKALGGSEVRVDFQIPIGATEIQVYRNGLSIYGTTDTNQTTFIDSGLSEGFTYRYNCVALADGVAKVGEEDFTVTTLSTNAPIFAGVKDVIVKGPNTAEVRWGVVDSSGVAVHKFHVFVNPGNLVEWGAAPYRIVDSAVLKIELDNLGDDLPYAFGVRACSAFDICDTNTIMIRRNTPDGGSPKTQGVTAAEIKNGEIILTAPWNHADGGIFKRMIYARQGPVGGMNLNDYARMKTVIVGNVENPPTILSLGGIQENQTYHLTVVDEDFSGKASSPTLFFTIATGDLTPPSFSGIGGVLKGLAGLENKTLILEFNATDIESPAKPDGAKDYLVYVTNENKNPCTDGLLHQTVAVSLFTPGTLNQHTISGLSERTQYRICMKARDAAGNISNTDTFLSKYTLDLTEPQFDGIQGAEYNAVNSKIESSWNPSPSLDIFEYVVKVWKNNVNPPAGEIETFKISAASFPSGFGFKQEQFMFVGNDQLYILVNACDNGHLIPEGSQNCSELSDPFMYLVPDVTPPQGFFGVQGSLFLETPAQGEIRVAWKSPKGGDWNDYRGFKVYHVEQNNPPIDDSDLVFMKDCPCSADNCPEMMTSCLITGLDHFRTYFFHVRAYDSKGNTTTYLNPAVYTTAKKTTDLTPPNFVSNLTAAYDQGKITLNWGGASDNQYPLEPSALLQYLVYRRTGQTFTTAFEPTLNADVLLMKTLTNETQYIDEALSSNVTYYYTVCAKDASQNQTCDGVVRNYTTPDVEPPVIANLTSNKLEQEEIKQWNLSWELTDNSPLSGVRVNIKAAINTTPEAPEAEVSYNTFVAEDDGIMIANNLTGPANQNRYIHYLITAIDQAGNKTSSKITLYSQNEVQILAVKRPSGPTTGGKFVVIEGLGFAQGATVTIGGQECTDVMVYTPEKLSCYTPILAQGSYTVGVTNIANTGFHQLAGAYTFVDPSNPSAHICDQPASQGSSFPQGDGSVGNPFLICNPDQLNNVRNQPSNRSYVLGDNIDLSAFTNNAFAPIRTTNNTWNYDVKFDGQGFYVANWTYINEGADSIGLFNRLYNSSLVKDVNLVNFDVAGRNLVGLLTGHISRGNCSVIVENIFVHGKVKGVDSNLGGIVGSVASGSFANIQTKIDVEGKTLTAGTALYYVGGVIGHNYGNCNFTEIHAAGSVTVDAHLNVGGLAGRHTDGNFSNSSFTGVVFKEPSTNWYYVGGAFGFAGTSTMATEVMIDNVHINAKVTGRHATGGFIGYGHGAMKITNSSFKGEVFSSNNQVGGFIGQFYSVRSPSVKNSQVDAKVEGHTDVGGFIGRILGEPSWADDGFNRKFTLEKNIARGSVSGIENVGGFVGYVYCEGARCLPGSNIHQNGSFSEVTGVQNGIGGFAGRLRGYPDTLVVSESFGRGNVTGAQCVGGFAGDLSATVQNSYARGVVTAADKSAAIGGCVYNDTTYATRASYIYGTGMVNVDLGLFKGGAFGHQSQSGINPFPKEYEAVLWDTTTTTQNSSVGSTDTVMGMATAMMQTEVNYYTLGFDMLNIWKMPIGGGYPVLRWETP